MSAVDPVNYHVKFISPLHTSDGRVLEEVNLRPVLTREFEAVMRLETPYKMAAKVICDQLEITPEDLGGLDMRDTTKLLAVVENFFPAGLLY